jgi:hypothetical protein
MREGSVAEAATDANVAMGSASPKPKNGRGVKATV